MKMIIINFQSGFPVPDSGFPDPVPGFTTGFWFPVLYSSIRLLYLLISALRVFRAVTRSGIPNLFKNLLASLPKILGVSRNDPGHDLKSQLFDENFIPYDKF